MIPFDKVQAIWQEFQREYVGSGLGKSWISDYGGLERMHGIARVDGQLPSEMCIAVRIPERLSTWPEIYQGVPVVYITEKVEEQMTERK